MSLQPCGRPDLTSASHFGVKESLAENAENAEMRQRKGGFEIVLDSRRPCTGRCAHHLNGSSPRSPRSPREIFRSAFMSDLRRSGSLGILFPRTRVGVGRDPDK